MKFIKTLSILILLSFAVVGCSNENVDGKEAVLILKTAEAQAENNQIPNFNPFVSEHDIFIMKLLGSFFNLTPLKSFLEYLGADLTNYTPPAIAIDEMIMIYFYLSAIVIAIAGIIKLFLVSGTSALTGEGLKDGLFNIGISLLKYFAFIMSFGFIGLVALIWTFAGINALSSNAVNKYYNTTNNIASTDPVQHYFKANENGQLIVQKAFEQFRTEQARAYRKSTMIDRGDTLEDFVEEMNKLNGIEYATNLKRTVDWLDMAFSFGFGNAVYKFFSAEKYVSDIKIFGKRGNSLFSTDELDFPSSNFQISLSRDVIEDKSDLNAGTDNSLSRRNIIASAMSETGIDAFDNYKKLKESIKEMFEKGGDKTSDDLPYLAMQTDLKDKFLQKLNKMEPEFKTFKNEAERTELMTSSLMLMVAQASGLNRDEDIIKIFNDLKDGSMKSWASVNCTMNKDFYDLHISHYQKLTSNYKSGFYNGFISWESVDPSCVYYSEDELVNLANPSSNKEEIKQKEIDAKSGALALPVYYNIIELAAIEALQEFSPRISNTKNECLKYQLKGFIGMPSQISCLIKSKHRTETGLAKIKNAITVSYANSFKENNNYIDELAVFGRAGDKNYVKDEDRKPYLDIFKPVPFLVLFDQKSNPSGNIATIQMQEESAEAGLIDKIMDEFKDIIMGPLATSTKYAAGLPMNKTVREGIRYCEENGCRDTYKPSIYEAVVVTGQNQTEAALLCVVTIAGVQGANNFLDFSDLSNSAGSSVGTKQAANLGKLGGKALKAVSEGLNVAAETMKFPCYTLLATGITSGTVMPIFFQFSLVGVGFAIIISYLSVLFVSPISVLMNLLSDNRNETLMRLVKYSFGVFIQAVLSFVGMLVTFAILMFPADWIAKIFIDFGYSDGSGFIHQVLTSIAGIVSYMIIWKKAGDISQNLVQSVMTYLDLHNPSAHLSGQFSAELVSVAATLAATHKVAQVGEQIQHLSNEQILNFKKAIVEEEERRKVNTDYNGSSRHHGAFESEGKGLDEQLSLKGASNIDIDKLREEAQKMRDENSKDKKEVQDGKKSSSEKKDEKNRGDGIES